VNHRNRRGATIAASALLIGGLTVAAVGAPAIAASAPDTSALREAITADGLQTHLDALQAIADANDDNRAAGTQGHLESLEYVEETLAAAGYVTQRQEFEYQRVHYETATLEQTAPTPTPYTLLTDFYPMDYTGDGDVTAAVQAVDINLAGDRASTSGCESTDFAGFTAGSIALIQRGSCDFSVKAVNALAAGAVGVIIFNQGNENPDDDRFGVFGGTLSSADWAGDDTPVPVVSTSFDQGAEWATTAGLVLHLQVTTVTTDVQTWNLLADTPTGRADRTVVVGAHLDSVPEGPGINDNGSGTAALMETALQLKNLGIQTENRIRFAFWSGEEDGLLGSSYYVSQLSKSQVKETAVNLNFDMLGSPNGGRFVYDGDGNGFGTSGPNGSDVVEGVFDTYFASQQLATEPTAFDGRSDYFAFIGAGIPAGGLFSGAEDIKSEAQVALYGGTPGVAFDPCYHQACDTRDNIDPVLFEQLADAAAHATYVFADTESAVNGTAKGKALGQWSPEYKGNRALR
jgi:Zn-dependent M28 family amino/carboxypeptidase